MQRRDLLVGLAALGATPGWAAEPTVRMTDGLPGTAGAIWHPLITRASSDRIAGRAVSWIGSEPGMTEIQVISGAVDVGAFGALTAARTIDRGTDIVMFGPGTINHARWIVRGNSSFQTPHDLIGHSISVPIEASEAFQQTSLAAQLHGIDLARDMHLHHTAPNVGVALFERGDLDGLVVLEPLATRLVVHGAREIARTSDMWTTAPETSGQLTLIALAARRIWVEQNKAVADGIASLQLEINKHITQHPGVLSEMAERLGIASGDRAVQEALPQRMADVYQDAWDDKAFAAIEAEIAVASRVGLIAQRDRKRFYENLSA